MCNHIILGFTVHSMVVRAACMIFLLTDKEKDSRRFPVLTLPPSLSYPASLTFLTPIPKLSYLTTTPHSLSYPASSTILTPPHSLSYPASLIILPCLLNILPCLLTILPYFLIFLPCLLIYPTLPPAVSSPRIPRYTYSVPAS